MKFLLILITLLAAIMASTASAAIPPLGAPADLVAYADGKPGDTDPRVGILGYDEPRVCTESQEWWFEGAGDMTRSIADAMKATHLHYLDCFPLMETWAESGGQFITHLKLQQHENVGGRASNAGGLGFEDGGAVKAIFNPAWAPTSADETRFAQLTRASSTVKVCGRRETRGHLNGISRNGGEEFFNSFGKQSLVACKTGRTLGNQRGPSIMYRGWYEVAAYTNITFVDDFRGRTGFYASEMSAPVGSQLKIKFSLGAGANKYLVSVDPAIHHGSYGRIVAQGTGTGFTADFAAVLPLLSPGLHWIMAAGCENLGPSPTNPIGGQNCGVGVVPFIKA